MLCSIPEGGESIYIVIKRKPIEDRPIMCILPMIVFFYPKKNNILSNKHSIYNIST